MKLVCLQLVVVIKPSLGGLRVYRTTGLQRVVQSMPLRDLVVFAMMVLGCVASRHNCNNGAFTQEDRRAYEQYGHSIDETAKVFVM